MNLDHFIGGKLANGHDRSIDPAGRSPRGKKDSVTFSRPGQTRGSHLVEREHERKTRLVEHAARVQHVGHERGRFRRPRGVHHVHERLVRESKHVNRPRNEHVIRTKGARHARADADIETVDERRRTPARIDKQG